MILDELDKATRIAHRLVTLIQLEQAHQVRPVDLDAELARIARRWAPTAEREWSARSSVGLTRVDPGAAGGGAGLSDRERGEVHRPRRPDRAGRPRGTGPAGRWRWSTRGPASRQRPCRRCSPSGRNTGPGRAPGWGWPSSGRSPAHSAAGSSSAPRRRRWRPRRSACDRTDPRHRAGRARTEPVRAQPVDTRLPTPPAGDHGREPRRCHRVAARGELPASQTPAVIATAATTSGIREAGQRERLPERGHPNDARRSPARSGSTRSAAPRSARTGTRSGCTCTPTRATSDQRGEARVGSSAGRSPSEPGRHRLEQRRGHPVERHRRRRRAARPGSRRWPTGRPGRPPATVAPATRRDPPPAARRRVRDTRPRVAVTRKPTSPAVPTTVAPRSRRRTSCRLQAASIRTP